MKSKEILLFIIAFVILYSFQWDYFSIIAVLLFVRNLYQLIINSNNVIAFREFVLVLFSLNYLLSPVLMYNGLDIYQTIYAMSIPKEEYFSLAIPAIILFQLAMYIMPVKIFSLDFRVLKNQAVQNERTFKQWTIAGVLLRFFAIGIPGELAFVVYLLSSIRFIGAFTLVALNFKKYKVYLLMVFFFEIAASLAQGMFQDSLLWLIFFSLFACRLFKPSLLFKIGIMILGIGFVFLLQLAKGDYRSRTWTGTEEAGISSFSTSIESSTETSSEGLLTTDRISNSLTRVNQGWIFASTVKNMQLTEDYQHWNLVALYLEAAILPRFLAPNKLTSGNRDIFNRYSGRYIGEGTSMGLGILADGYISFGRAGVYIFAFAFGLIFCLIFKVVERWTLISPFFILFIFPILHYACRPDCETQTILGHIVKSIFLFGCFVFYYKRIFLKDVSYPHALSM